MRIKNPAGDFALAKKLFLRIEEEVLQELVNKSCIDIKRNQELVSFYNRKVEEADQLRRKISILETRKIDLTIIMIAIPIIGIALCCISISALPDSAQIRFDQIMIHVLMILLGLLLCPIAVFPYNAIRYKISPLLIETEIQLSDAERRVCEAEEACLDNIRPYIKLIGDHITAEIISRTIDNLKIDRYLDQAQAKLIEDYVPDFFATDQNQSVLSILSGSSCSNPFIIIQQRIHHMVTRSYSGSRRVAVEYWERDDKGKMVRKYESEWLSASIEKPAPDYKVTRYLSFFSPEASDLSFTHKAELGIIDNPRMLKAGIEERLKRFEKESEKQLRRNTSSDANVITMMADQTFEAMFFAIDRTNDLEFRKLFTPKAQENMVSLMLEFGDYFNLEKSNRITKIEQETDNPWNMDTIIGNYRFFDYNEIVKQIKEHNLSYFENFYRMLAPILCIPLYSTDSIEDGRLACCTEEDSIPSKYMAEVLANSIGAKALLGEDKDIITTVSDEYVEDLFTVYHLDVFYYDEHKETETVRVRASDRSYHDVDIDWINYIPRHKCLDLKVCSSEMAEGDYYVLSQTEEFNEYCRCPHIYKDHLFGFIIDPECPVNEEGLINLFKGGEKAAEL